MFRKFPRFVGFPIAFAIAACTPHSALFAEAPAAQAQAAEPDWAFEESDLPLDTDFTYGKLANGIRYIIRHNETPKGLGLVRLYVGSGSLSESESELGYAHYIEHMAFNGSTNIPEGEMVKLLEREGLAFGADTNASTNFNVTLYQLDLPRNDPALLDTALMLMRETGSELSFTPEAVARERGVILSEKRSGDTYQFRDLVDALDFYFPGSQYASRLPIGETETLDAANSAKLKGLWDRLYTPSNSTLIVIGDFDVDQVKSMIEQRFSDWQAEPKPEEPSAGPLDPTRQGLTDIYTDPALPESVTVSRIGPWVDEPDTIAQRRIDVLRQIGYNIVNRRMQRIARQQDAPFRVAQLDTADVFKAGRTTNLSVVVGDGEWREGLLAAAREYRRALALGFSEAEVAEQVANLQTSIENAVAGADTRSNGSLLQLALSLVQDGRVPTTPQSGLERFAAMQSDITPENVLAALKSELVALDNPLIRFEGSSAPEGGAEALRAAWDEAIATPLEADQQAAAVPFGYTDFGPSGKVVSDTVEPILGIREVRFANGVRLNLRQTDLQRDRIMVQFNLDGGNLLDTKENPLATQLIGGLTVGGLGKHSLDELQSILAGRSVNLTLQNADETFLANVATTPRDLELQLELFAALITDPGYRTEGEIQFKRNITNFFSRRNATPSLTFNNAIGALKSDNDPRFSLLDEDRYLALDFAKLRADISDRLQHGAIELALVGDFDPDVAIATVARTLGALPARESDFLPYADNRDMTFTADRSQRVLYHDGDASQAMIVMIWPTRDDSDLGESAKLELLDRVMKVELIDKLREELGKTYSPVANSALSRVYPGYGTFTIASEIDTSDVDAAREAILELLHELAAAPVDGDVLLRARQPLIETIENTLKTNGGWMGLVDRAQTEADRIERFAKVKDAVTAVTPEDIHAMVERYLDPAQRLEVVVLPRPKVYTGDE